MGGGGSKDIDDKISQLASQVANISTEGHAALEKLTGVQNELGNLRTLMTGVNNTVSNIKDNVGKLATDVEAIKQDIADIHKQLEVVHQDHIQEIAALNNLSSQITWSTMVLQIAEPASRIESMYSFLMKLEFGSRTAARWFVRDVLSVTTGVIEALYAINSVLIGKVVVDPKQGPMLLFFKQSLDDNKNLDENQKNQILINYFNSLAFLQIKGIILLVNAYRAIGDNLIAAKFIKQTRTDIFRQYILLRGDTYQLRVVGVNHGEHRSSVMSRDTIQVNGELVGEFVKKYPFKGFHVTVLPIFNPYLILRSEFFDTTNPDGEKKLALFLKNERLSSIAGTILIVASTGPVGNFDNGDLRDEMTHLIGDGFKAHFLNHDVTCAFAVIEGDLRITASPQTDMKSVELKVKLQLDINNPDTLKFLPPTVNNKFFALANMWDDVLVRTGPGDNGEVPYKGANWISPDILNNGIFPKENVSDWETQHSYDYDISNIDFETNNTNCVYVRMKNLSNVQVTCTVRLYLSPGAILNIPSKFIPIPYSEDLDENMNITRKYDLQFPIGPGQIKVTPFPFLWNPGKDINHPCIQVMVGTQKHPLPDLSKVTALDILNTIHRNIAQRNVALIPVKDNVLEHNVRAYIDESRLYQFQLHYEHMPDAPIHLYFCSVIKDLDGHLVKKDVTVTDNEPGKPNFVGVNANLLMDWDSQFVVRCTSNAKFSEMSSLNFVLYTPDNSTASHNMTREAFFVYGIRPRVLRKIGNYCIKPRV